MQRREQTLLFSATIDPKQRSLINTLVQNPFEIKVSKGTTATNMVDQDIIEVGPTEDKFGKLLNLINNESFEKVILFAETKRLVDRLSKKLSKSGVPSGMIHGDKSQNYRTRAIEEFKRGRTRVLVATDVAARGIDIQNVTHVINYQLPMTMDSYIHRIGRTGRAGNKGMAYTFVN
jgi:ATP-dependent RNA helicase RhlE